MMERRELYHPEDIEQLLLERSYDELLDEERAFVLQHLTGRDEYESMRALLLRMHGDEERAGTDLNADPGVRDHLMAVFHAQQQPRWRIWLNSSLAWFTPRGTGSLWRPALAFGSLAVVVVCFLLVGRTLAPGPTEMAAVQEGQEKPTPNVTNAPETGKAITGSTAPAAATSTANLVPAEPEKEEVDINSVRSEDLDLASNGVQPGSPVISEAAQQQVNAPLATTMDSVMSRRPVAEEQSLSHQVTRDELYSNMSSAATRAEAAIVMNEKTVRAKERKSGEAAASETLGTDDARRNVVSQELLGVLRAAW